MALPDTHQRPILRQIALDAPTGSPSGESYSARVADARQLAESCRVVFDLERLRVNIQAGIQDEKVSPEDVCDWLEALGFSPSSDGAWIGRKRTLRHFAEGEVVKYDDIK
ncbi:MAG TPA: hypothetical protein VFE47_12140 [Tepidisphaeraceae bacterium]|jgi:hypothetical protein|nr:hypothetical protein [Tepidisphaeraceae bacterium]